MSDSASDIDLDTLENGQALQDEVTTDDSDGATSWKGDSKEVQEPPRASWFLLLQFCTLGFVALAPWNFILTDLLYLTNKFEHRFSSTISIYDGLANNVAQLFIIFFGNKFTFAPRFDIGCSLLAVFNICLAIVAMTVGVDNPCPSTDLGNALGIVCVVILAFGHAIMESTALGLAALCPKSCINWVMVGEGMAGVIGWPLLELFDCIFQNVHRKDEWVCLVFFSVTSVLTLLIMPMFRLITSKDPLIKQVLTIEDQRRKAGSLKVRQTRRPVRAILKDLAPMAFCAWSVLTITFICFPSQATLWQAGKGTPEATAKFIPLVTFVYQVGDTVGRFAPNVGLAIPQKALIVVSLARSLFIPLFICTTLYPTVKPFQWNWFKHIEMLIFALSNGLCATLSMMYGPQRVSSDKAEQEVAGYTMAFTLVDGIFVGGLLGTLTVSCLGE
ncbi:equilibrative nucleoside transporter, putative [Perkinsus marinus ATCC 50983]|uniref:Equilibrative nucleoside transporter, putative n=1 Tax=Perkinsus marinus (strain ATCC 50983 / TXsc) TaxID=423536 RepID=C5LBX3_PERM5|nr:equilibrative nucleoside transporter, putative [Perkinsus marinus ATCC 50983]EER05456.1 equilibrative nucleoside transporter, putative [Perkinsus marinus ATCC 50983]|eukprot:XP_002773640.1 equilibrative nucleoside transporter, putative [Perkinsus marinus ATCC 50983]